MPVKLTQVAYKAKDTKQPWKSCSNCGTLTVYVAVLTALLSLCDATAAGDSGQPLRLAILSSEKVQDLGLADLLTVQMQNLTGVELVERDLLQKALHEIALSLMLGADEAENRRKAGAILKADMLVLLSFEDAAGGKPTVKLVISDCSHGARLRIAWIPLPSGSLENACRDLAEIVRGTLAQLPQFD